MKVSRESRAHRLAVQRRQAVESLKRCPLCGAINSITNEECFKCSWHGTFDHDPDHVEEGLGQLLDLCPELADAMAEAAPDEPFTLWQRIRQAWFRTANRWMARLMRRPNRAH